MNNKIKTLDVNAKEYFDKLNGNSHFSVQITINFGLKSEKMVYIPYQYGYESQYEFISLDELLPSAEEYGEHHVAIYGLTGGMVVMALSLLFLV